MPAQLGTGISIAFATSTGFTPRILGVIFSAISRAVIPNHDMASTHMDKSPGTIPDWGSIDIEYEQDQNEVQGASSPPIEALEESITFQWPLKGAEVTAGATLVGVGFVSNFTFPAPFEERSTGTFTVTWATKPVHTVGS